MPTPVPSFPGLQDWQRLISFRPDTLLQLSVNARFQTFGLPARIIHEIEVANGDINLDYYPIRITALPIFGGQTMQAAALLEFIRRNINSFVDTRPEGANFVPYDSLIDGNLWSPQFGLGSSPGAVLSIDIYSSVQGVSVNVDDGSVLLSESTQDHWIFSTLWTPNDLGHPVSGNREFGFKIASAGEFIFYTRGADRLTSLLDTLAADAAFNGADKLWRSFQRRIADFVNANGGIASIEPRLWDRYDWSTVKTQYFNPTVQWI
jgi:hypothetical protein